MKKVVILGSPGSGKSTFAARLHEKTGLPVVHLDFFYHQKRFNYYNDREAWVARVNELMKSAKWIMDGNYQSTIPMRCEQADTIILFDLPRWLCIYRVFKRRLVYSNKARNDMPSEWQEKADWQFLKYLWTFNKCQLPPTREVLSRHPNKAVHIFKSSSEVETWLEEL